MKIKIVVALPKSRGVIPPPTKKHGSPKGKRGYNRNRAKRDGRHETD